GMRERAVSVSSSSYNFWAQGVGYLDDMKSNAAVGTPAARSTTGGFQAGADQFVSEGLLFGVSGGYAGTRLDVTDRSATGNTTSIQSGLYAHCTRGPWFTHA